MLTTIGPYHVIEKIGTGEMGEVYRARDARLERDIAIKVLPPALASDAERKERLFREARAAAALSHPHILAIYDVGEFDGHPYVAMELVDGQSLSARLEARAPTSDELLRYARQLAEAMAHAHAYGVIHRDIKTANVMITPKGDVKVVDFGLAKLVAGPAAAEAITRATITQPGAIVGTMAYMSPEQFRGATADARSDVWALGVVLYEMAVGAPPFTASTGFALSAAVIHDAPPPLPSHVAPGLQTIVDRCLEKEPARRYQHAGELRAALEMLPAVGAPASPPKQRSTSTGVIAALAAAGIIVAGIVTWRLSTDRARPLAAIPSAPITQPTIRLAVVPFENLTGDPQQDYFSDGLTEEMIAQLGTLAPQRLRVIGRTSVMRYKGTRTGIDQIGRELGVDYVLTGSARRDAARVRVTAQLVQVRDQAQLWSDTYDRDLASILALQNDVSQRVARGLALQLLSTERRTDPVDPEAYDLYLQGRAQLNSGPLALDRAQQMFERALTKNPKDALSYAGLAAVWKWRALVQTVLGKEANAHQKEMASRAVVLDDRSAASHAALASAYSFDYDWSRAEVEFKRAFELNPNDAEARANYGVLLALNRRMQEADTHIEWAVALEPFDNNLRLMKGTVLLAAGRLDDAIRHLRSSLTSAPGVYQFHWLLWRTLHAKGNDDEALAELIALLTAIRGDQESVPALEQGARAGGYREGMRRCAAVRESQAKARPPRDPAFIALLHHDAGDRDRAYFWMERALDDRDPNLQYLGILAPDLKDDPRFRSLMQRIGLPY
ncbi:MAG TPA: protein kinase [Vicinamibacterales bacterium]|nr:protein kinase [Vicinamibacterales bacterium]